MAVAVASADDLNIDGYPDLVYAVDVDGGVHYYVFFSLGEPERFGYIDLLRVRGNSDFVFDGDLGYETEEERSLRSRRFDLVYAVCLMSTQIRLAVLDILGIRSLLEATFHRKRPTTRLFEPASPSLPAR